MEEKQSYRCRTRDSQGKLVAAAVIKADLLWVSMSHTQRVTFPTAGVQRVEKVKVSSGAVQERSSEVLLPAYRLLLLQSMGFCWWAVNFYDFDSISARIVF